MTPLPPSERNLSIAVVGSGIAGITASYLLGKHHRVRLFEKNRYVGGHTHTIVVPEGADKGTPIDTGFIVLNERTYPNFIRLLSLLGVEKEKTDMSFSYTDPDSEFTFASKGFDGIFAQRMNLLKPLYWKFLAGVLRFLHRTRQAHEAKTIDEITLGEFLDRERVSQVVKNRFVVPMAAAIWSAPDAKIVDFPMRTYAQFYANHGLLQATGHPQWYFIKGGSHRYVASFLNVLGKQNLALRVEVKGIRRQDDNVFLLLNDGEVQRFDKVVIATHADEALTLLDDPTQEEQRLLSKWSYSKNKTVLHTDSSWMSPNRRAWASWNYRRRPDQDASSPITVTYYMNRLQQLKCQHDYFVTLNPSHPISNQHRVCELTYTHPIYTAESFATQTELASLNGQKNTYFCGAYFGYGFHEDGVKSALDVARHFGVSL